MGLDVVGQAVVGLDIVGWLWEEDNIWAMGVSHDVPLMNSGNTIVLILVVCKMVLPR